MISQESKDVIDALSIDELRYEVELGNRSRFQRENMAYLKVRLRSLEEGSNPTNPEPPKLIQNLSWLAKNAKNHKGLVAVASLLLLTSVIYANRDSWDIWPSPDPLENCLLYTSPSPRDRTRSRMPSSA